jgi:hypothetical protein
MAMLKDAPEVGGHFDTSELVEDLTDMKMLSRSQFAERLLYL